MKVFYDPIWRYSLIESEMYTGVKMLSDLKAEDRSKSVVVIDNPTQEILFTGNLADADLFYRAEILSRRINGGVMR